MAQPEPFDAVFLYPVGLWHAAIRNLGVIIDLLEIIKTKLRLLLRLTVTWCLIGTLQTSVQLYTHLPPLHLSEQNRVDSALIDSIDVLLICVRAVWRDTTVSAGLHVRVARVLIPPTKGAHGVR